jgi:hypothetical protein
VEAPAKALVEAANRGFDAKQRRNELMATAEAGDAVAAFIGLAQVTNDLRKVQERLERTADAAEQDGQRVAVASLAGQQIRATEVRARLGGLGGYVQPKGEKSDAPAFAINIHFSGHRTERLTLIPSEGLPSPEDAPRAATRLLPPLSPAPALPALSEDEDEDEGDAEFDEEV